MKLYKFIYKIIAIGIIIYCGSMIKRTIKEECPLEYKEAIKNAPWHIKLSERIF
jgi:hypothetical protein